MNRNSDTPCGSDAVSLTPLAIWAIGTYIAVQVISNVASLKIGVVAGLAVDMGTFLYPLTFTLRDVVHKVAGRYNARAMIFAAGAVNLLMAAYFEWIVRVPGDPDWGMNEQFGMILAPVWRLVAASILAQIVAELLDTEAYHLFVTRVTRRYQWLRVLVSNSVSVPADNLVFALGAFAFALPWSVVWDIFLINLIVKYAVTVLSIPLIYVIPLRREAVGQA